MKPAKTEFTAEEINEKLIDSIYMIKNFKKLLSLHLRMWKCYYTYNEFIAENLHNNQIESFLKKYDLSLSYCHWSNTITLFSNLDNDLKVSEEFFNDLLTDKAHNYFEKTHKEYKDYVYNAQGKNKT